MTALWPPELTPMFHNLVGLSGETPQGSYSWQDEVDGLDARLAKLTDEDVYLLGISGGATLALSYIAEHPHRVAGMGLIEPAWSFLPMTEVERNYYEELDRVLNLPPSEQRDAFVRMLLLPEVRLPAVTATAAIGYQRAQRAEDTAFAIVTRAMRAHRIAPSQLQAFPGAVYLAVGGRSSPMWKAQAKQLQAALPEAVVEIYPERHHLDAPHHAEAQRLTNALLAAWQLS